MLGYKNDNTFTLATRLYRNCQFGFALYFYWYIQVVGADILSRIMEGINEVIIINLYPDPFFKISTISYTE